MATKLQDLDLILENSNLVSEMIHLKVENIAELSQALKCGEVFISSIGNCYLVCDKCHKKYIELGQFVEHFQTCQSTNWEEPFIENLLVFETDEILSSQSELPDTIFPTSIGSTSRQRDPETQQLLGSRTRIDISEAGLATQQQKQLLLSPTSISSTNRRESTNQLMLGPGQRIDFSEIRLSPPQRQSLDTISTTPTIEEDTISSAQQTIRRKLENNKIIKEKLQIEYEVLDHDSSLEENSENSLEESSINLGENCKNNPEQRSGNLEENCKNLNKDFENLDENSEDSIIAMKNGGTTTELLITQKPNVLQCQFCHKEYKNKVSLEKHEKLHNQTKPGQKYFVCIEVNCDKSFDTRKGYGYHMRHTHGINAKTYKCDECQKVFKAKANLEWHKKRHLGIKTFQCDQCSKTFLTKSEVSYHARIHTNILPIQCELCGKKFRILSKLAIHKKRHNNIRDYVCEICNKGFYTSNILKLHKITHNPEAPRNYKCDKCTATFKTNDVLLSHMELHLPIKKYQCQLCSKRFAQRAGLHGHMRIVHLNIK